MVDKILQTLSATVAEAQTTEQLARPLLALLERVTGLESTYLTRVDPEAGVQRVIFSRNTKEMHIPEGLSVPWEDTLCKRALDENRPFTEDAGECWGDCDAARALGIRTYVSTPIYEEHGRLFGTLCAASSSKHSISQDGKHVLTLFGALIAQQLQREDLLRRLMDANRRLQAQTVEDPLTQLPNRRGIFEALESLFRIAECQGCAVDVAFIDLDRFKHINDQFGHDVGDAFLIEVGRRLRAGLPPAMVIGRLGGDEFIVAGLGRPLTGELDVEASNLAERIGSLICGEFRLADQIIDYAGPSVGLASVAPATCTPQRAIQMADNAMYVEKKGRRKPH